MNEDKGGIAKKSCSVACIGCTKCFKVCPYDAITMNNNLAFIDSEKCKLCRKCVEECPTNSILEIGFPPRKIKETGTSENAQAGPSGNQNTESTKVISEKNKEE